MEVLVVEQDRRIVEALRAAGTAAVYGDAGHELVLERAHLERAILLVVALRDPQTSRRVIQVARRANERTDRARRTRATTPTIAQGRRETRCARRRGVASEMTDTRCMPWVRLRDRVIERAAGRVRVDCQSAGTRAPRSAPAIDMCRKSS